METLKESIGATAAAIFEDEKDRKQHLTAIEMLSLRIGASIEDVEKVYNIVLKRLKKSAKIKDFLPILVSRRVEYLLNERRNCKKMN